MNAATSVGPVSTTETDWVNQVLDTVEGTVAKVRAATTDRVVLAVRMALYGLMAAGVAVVIMLLLTIGAVRLLVILLPARNDAWAAYTIVGGLLVLVGWLFLWRKRHPTR